MLSPQVSGRVEGGSPGGVPVRFLHQMTAFGHTAAKGVWVPVVAAALTLAVPVLALVAAPADVWT